MEAKSPESLTTTYTNFNPVSKQVWGHGVSNGMCEGHPELVISPAAVSTVVINEGFGGVNAQPGMDVRCQWP